MLFGTHVHTKTYTRMFTAALFINAKNLETTILSWVNGYINLGTSDNGILFSAEKNEHSNHEKTCEVKVKVTHWRRKLLCKKKAFSSGQSVHSPTYPNLKDKLPTMSINMYKLF